MITENVEGMKFKQYDFRRPDKFSKDQIRTVQMVHESFSRLASYTLSANLRTVAEAHVYSVDQLTYDEFIRKLDNPNILCISSVKPLNGYMLFQLDPRICFNIIETLVGGESDNNKDFINREITRIESNLLKNIFSNLLINLRDSWSSAIGMYPKIECIETNPVFAQIVHPMDMILLVSIELKIGNVTGNMQICIPYITIEPIIHRLNAIYWHRVPSAPKIPKDNMLDKKYRLFYDFDLYKYSIYEILDLCNSKKIPVVPDLQANISYGLPELMSNFHENDIPCQASKEKIKNYFIEKPSEGNSIDSEGIKLITPNIIARVGGELSNIKDIKYKNDKLSIDKFINKCGKLVIGDRKLADFEIIQEDNNIYLNLSNTPKSVEDLSNVKFKISAEFTPKWLCLEEFDKIKEGHIMPLCDLADAPIQLRIDNVGYFKGFIYILDESFCLKVTECVKLEEIKRQYRLNQLSASPKESPEVFLRFSLGEKIIKLNEITEIKENSVIKLNKYAGMPVDIYVNNKPSMLGEVVIINNSFGIRICGLTGDSDNEELERKLDRKSEEEKVIYEKEMASNKFEINEKPFESIINTNSATVAKFLENEHPQTIAGVLANISSEKASAILSNFPVSIHSDIIKRISNIDRISPNITTIVGNTLDTLLKDIKSSHIADGIDTAVEIMNLLDRSTEKAIIEELEASNPELSEKIKKRMFVFEDIILLDDRSIQKVLVEIDSVDLAKALKAVDNEVKDRIFNNMSNKGATLLKEDMEKIGSVKLTDVEQAQQSIVGVIRRLHEANEIYINDNPVNN